MIDISNINKYKENNRIEAKKSLGGLPKSLWETYSAFANTLGGIILLGVEEHSDKTLHAIDLPDPDTLIREFWDTINNRNKISVNILTGSNVKIEEVDGKWIVAITVPRAGRYDKPVYIDGNPLTGTYRRNGEGDYKCTPDEVRAMLRDASVKTQDMSVLPEMALDVFDYDSIHRYRIRMKNNRPGHVWEELDDVEFLYRLGAVGRSDDGAIHPTAAGLLMFGHEYEIIKEYPLYFLDYRDQTESETRWTDRIVSSSGDWSGNVYDFYFRVYNKIIQDIKVPFKVENGARVDDTPVHVALREALANCIVNSDYYGGRGVVIVKKRESITFSNPGGFRIAVDDAICGGVSDPRNTLLMKMFNLINIGERAGSGIPSIYSVWRRQCWPEPVITESFDPARITLTLILRNEALSHEIPESAGSSRSSNSSHSSHSSSSSHSLNSSNSYHSYNSTGGGTSAVVSMKQAMILEYLTYHISATTSEIAEYIQLKPSRVRDYMSGLVKAGFVVAEGETRNRKYSLKC